MRTVVILLVFLLSSSYYAQNDSHKKKLSIKVFKTLNLSQYILKEDGFVNMINDSVFQSYVKNIEISCDNSCYDIFIKTTNNFLIRVVFENGFQKGLTIKDIVSSNIRISYIEVINKKNIEILLITNLGSYKPYKIWYNGILKS
ncbi:MAG: hypothetical protein ACLGGV_10165 [Bacteroidia bacterium]